MPDYELIKLIGEGSYGEVWLAKGVTGTYRAIKIVYRNRFTSHRPYEREFSGLCAYEAISQSHPQLLNILHVGKGAKDAFFYYVMEIADAAAGEGELIPNTYEARNLRTELASRGAFPVDDCIRIGHSLTLAVQYLHECNLLHRDIKPSNIIFVSGVPKLADIGLVTSRTERCSFVGTEGYIPPEGPGSVQSDVYALGKVLYEMATNRSAQDFPELATDAIQGPRAKQVLALNSVILKACEPIAEKRYPTCQELAEDLVSLQHGRKPKKLWLIPWRRMAAAVGLLVVPVILAGTGLRYCSRPDDPKPGFFGFGPTLPFVLEDEWASGFTMAAYVATNRAPDYMALSSDGQRFAYADRNHFQVHQTITGEALLVAGRRGTNYVRLAFSPCQNLLAAGRADGSIELWDISAQRMQRRLAGHGRRINDLRFSPDGAKLASAAYDSTARLWMINDGTEWARLEEGPGWVSRVAFAPDGATVATAHQHGGVKLWEIDADGVHPMDRPDHLALLIGVVALEFSPDGTHLAVGDNHRGLMLWNLVDHRVAFQSFLSERPTWVRFEPDGGTLWTLADDNQLRQIDVHSGDIMHQVHAGHSISWRAHISKEACHAIAYECDTGIHILNLSSHKVSHQRVSGSGGPVTEVLWTDVPHAAWLTRVAGGKIQQWDLQNSTVRGIRSPESVFGRVALRPDHASLVLMSKHNDLMVWDFVSNAMSGMRVFHEGRANGGPAYIANGNWLALGTDQGDLWAYPKDLDAPPVLMGTAPHPIGTLAASPDGHMLAAADGERYITFWQILDQSDESEMVPPRIRAAGQVTTPSGEVYRIRFWANNERLAAGCANDTVQVWHVPTRRYSHHVHGQAGRTHDLVVTADDQWLFMVDQAGTLMVRDPENGRLHRMIIGNWGALNSIAFSPDESRLAVGGQDGSIRIFQVDDLIL